MNFDENLLIKACQANNDLKSFERLVKIHQISVRAVIYKLIPNPDDLEDMIQDVFIKAYQNITKFKGESSFKTWLCSIAINLCKNKILLNNRHKDKIISIDDKEFDMIPDNTSFNPEKFARLKETERSVLKVVKELPYNQQIAVILHDVEDFSYEDISKICNCPVGTVKSRLFNARKALKDKLQLVSA